MSEEGRQYMGKPPEATPWQYGYMDGRAASGNINECPYCPDSDEQLEWLNGFDAGRDDLRQGV